MARFPAAPTKIPVITKKHYRVWLEAFAGGLWIHCDVYKWSKEVKNQLRLDFNTLLSLVNLPVFAMHDPEDIKHKKFLKLFGFVFYKHTMGKDNRPREIWVTNTQ